MLATMSHALQTQHDYIDSYEMIEHTKPMFEGKSCQERFDTSKLLYACKPGEKYKVRPHVLKMIGYMEYLTTLGSAIGWEAKIDLISQSLNNNYPQFVMNYNMNEINKIPTELLAILKNVETNIQKASPTTIMIVKRGAPKGRVNGKEIR